MTKKKTNSKKRKTSKTSLKKGKIYIPAHKAILLCGSIIVICMGLLLATTASNPQNQKKEYENPITERFTNDYNKNSKIENDSSTNAASDKKNIAPVNTPAKNEKAVSPEIVKKENPINKKTNTESPKPAETKKVDNSTNKNSNVKKPEAEKQINKTENNIKNQNTNGKNQSPAVPQKKDFGFPHAVNNAQLVFVFDDGGQNLRHLDNFLKLPFNVSIAVLPRLQYSKESAEKIRQSKHELMLHQPMQAINENVNPGPGAIKPEMSPNEIKSVLFQNFTELGQIAGFNNHEGSLITADAEKMAVILQFASEQGVFFLDSRTNVETKVPYVAQEMGYSYYERNIFLDNKKTRENALLELKRGLDIANKTGVCIMIGHVWSADFLPALLEEAYPELKAKGYTFSTVSKSKGKKS